MRFTRAVVRKKYIKIMTLFGRRLKHNRPTPHFFFFTNNNMRARSFTAPSQLERNGSISSTRRRSSDSGCAGGGHDGRAAGAAAGPTCHGLMDNTIDALLIFEACRQGLVQKVSRRITEADPIVSGCKARECFII